MVKLECSDSFLLTISNTSQPSWMTLQVQYWMHDWLMYWVWHHQLLNHHFFVIPSPTHMWHISCQTESYLALRQWLTHLSDREVGGWVVEPEYLWLEYWWVMTVDPECSAPITGGTGDITTSTPQSPSTTNRTIGTTDSAASENAAIIGGIVAIVFIRYHNSCFQVKESWSYKQSWRVS